LRLLLGSPESLVTDPGALENYHHDATPLKSAVTTLLLAEAVEDILAAVRFCASEKIPITPRGAGTGLSGGCLVTPGGLLISTEQMCDMQILPGRKLALCEPGVITKELADAAAEFGLTYPPDPASHEESTLGGNIAENAGGLRCKRFGVTKDYVIGLEAVLADGTLLKTGLFNDGRGLALGDLLIGSEGTLGLVTRIALRLAPQPGRGDTILAGFDRPEDSARTVAEINASGLIPTVMEFLDGDAAACSNEYERSADLDRVAALLLFETSDADGPAQVAAIRQICERNGCSYFRSESDPVKAEKLWKVRRNLSNAVKALAGLRVSEDVAVPNSRFPALVAFVAEMNARSFLRINSYGHAGDGNLHVNFMAAEDTPENWREVDRWVDVLVDKTLALGGTLTGEHGIGLAKRKYMGLEFGPSELRLMRTIKSALDPGDLFNPDKLFPPQENLI
jgi:glycolate oxidase subunit GlcD